ncbi:MAG: hypothetical protein ABID64_05025 [Nitrospirota bacterium]
MEETNGNLAKKILQKPKHVGPFDYSKATDDLLTEEGEAKGQNVMEWINDVEMEKAIGLSTEIRREVANTLTASDTPEADLIALKDKLLQKKSETNKPAAVVIDEMIRRIGKNVEEVTKFKSPEPKTPEELYALAIRSLQNTVDSAEDSGAENVKEVQDVADRINKIFEDLKEEIESGYITSDVEELQNKIDGYVENLKFDEGILSGSVKKYLELSKVSPFYEDSVE